MGEPAGGLNARSVAVKVAAGLVLGGIAIAAVVISPLTLLAFLLILCLVAAGELFRLVRAIGVRPLPLVGFAAIGGMFAAAYDRGDRFVSVVPGVAAATVGTSFLVLLLRRRREGAVPAIAATLFTTLYAGMLGAYMIAMRRSAFGFRQVLVFGLMAVLHDAGSFFLGVAAGRHPIARGVSPDKTWEGWLGGTLFTFTVAAVAAWRLDPPFTLGRSLVLAGLVSIVAPLGDLAESALKRDAGVKDAGTMFPGHGGVLDRIDSVLFVAPVFFHAFRVLTR